MSITTAKKWTCDECGVSISRMGGERVELPETWSRGKEGTYCLICRRERAARAALDEYLRRFPNGDLAGQAKRLRKKLR